MKTIYSFIFILLLGLTVTAQTRLQGTGPSAVHVSSTQIQIISDASRAAGDTLMYMPLDAVFVNPTDSAAFNIVTEDIDGYTTVNAGVPVDFGVVYSTNSDTSASGVPTGDNFYHPWEMPGVDSSFFWYATSWFNPAGQADNWLMFGPITIPAAGAVLSWYERCNPAYRDGYKVLATTTPSVIVTNTDFIDPPFYTRTDAYPSPTYATDTTWVLKSVAIPASYNSMPIYIGYHHDANDMDVLYIDEIKVTEAPLGIADHESNATILSQNTPNPSNDVTSIAYYLSKPANVSFNVYDLTGRVVLSSNQGYQSSGAHNYVLNTRLLDSGIYFYTLTAGDVTTTKRMVVSR